MSAESLPIDYRGIARRTVLSVAAGSVAVGVPLVTAAPVSAAPSASSEQIELAKQRLNAQRYWCGPANGTMDDLATCALLAYQKANGLVADGLLDYDMIKRLATPRPTPRFTKSGRVLEVDLKRQLVRMVDDGKVLLTLHATTGGLGTSEFGEREVLDRTPVGKFRIRGHEAGVVTTSLGTTFSPHYFLGRYALYGKSDLATIRRPSTTGGVAVHVDAITYLAKRALLPKGRLVLIA